MNANRIYQTLVTTPFLEFVNNILNPHVASGAADNSEILPKVAELFGVKISNAPRKEGSGTPGRIAKAVIPPSLDRFAVEDIAASNDISKATANMRLKAWIAEGRVELAQGTRMPRNGGRPMLLYRVRETAPVETVAEAVAAPAENVAEAVAAPVENVAEAVAVPVIEAAAPVETKRKRKK